MLLFCVQLYWCMSVDCDTFSIVSRSLTNWLGRTSKTQHFVLHYAFCVGCCGTMFSVFRAYCSRSAYYIFETFRSVLLTYCLLVSSASFYSVFSFHRQGTSDLQCDAPVICLWCVALSKLVSVDWVTKWQWLTACDCGGMIDWWGLTACDCGWMIEWRWLTACNCGWMIDWRWLTACDCSWMIDDDWRRVNVAGWLIDDDWRRVTVAGWLTDDDWQRVTVAGWLTACDCGWMIGW